MKEQLFVLVDETKDPLLHLLHRRVSEELEGWYPCQKSVRDAQFETLLHLLHRRASEELEE